MFNKKVKGPRRRSSGYETSSEKKAGSHIHRRGANRQLSETLTLHSLLTLHRQVSKDALNRLIGSPVASLLNSLLIGFAFSLPALLYVLAGNLQDLVSTWNGQPKITIYLKNGAKQHLIDRLIADFHEDPLIEEILYISPEQGVKDFQHKTGLQDVISQLGFNPLPAVIELVPVRSATFVQLDAAAGRFEDMTGVDQVHLDRQWVKRLEAILVMLERFALMLGVVLGLTVFLVISNTVRLSIESRRQEIKIVSLVGGTHGFIAMPFIYMGIWYGVLGAVLAQAIVSLLLMILSHEVMRVAILYHSEVRMSGPSLEVLGVMLLVGILLGGIGAMSSCYRHLSTLAPV